MSQKPQNQSSSKVSSKNTSEAGILAVFETWSEQQSRSQAPTLWEDFRSFDAAVKAEAMEKKIKKEQEDKQINEERVAKEMEEDSLRRMMEEELRKSSRS